MSPDKIAALVEDDLLPNYDATDTLQCASNASLHATRWALQTYDLSAHAGVLSGVLKLAQRLPAPPPGTTRLVQLRRLRDAAMQVSDAGMMLGFVGKIWQPHAVLRLPGSADFANALRCNASAAGVLWSLHANAAEHTGRAQLRLVMRLRFPQRSWERVLCATYWKGVQRLSAWVRLQLLESVAQHATHAPAVEGAPDAAQVASPGHVG